MASTIIGTYPIINKQLSYIDDFGIQTLSYVFTVKTEVAYNYIPKKNDEYYGPNNATFLDATLFNPQLSEARSKYLVKSVAIDNLNGGLTQIIVNTTGTQNVQSAPLIEILPNYPIIFGLSGFGASEISEYQGVGNDINGFAVRLSFITKSNLEDEGYIISNFSNKIMPASFRNTLLPIPNKSPFNISYLSPPGTTQGATQQGFVSSYSGFICKETLFERIGGVTFFKLLYKEVGSYATTVYNPATQTQGASTRQTIIYNYA